LKRIHPISENAENSLKIFGAIYGENHEFIKYYIKENPKGFVD
jgi:hypothetical protein